MVTLKIKENSKQAKAVLEMLKTFSFVEIIQTGPKEKEKSPYDPKFVAKIEKSKQEFKEGKSTRVKKEDLQSFLGL